MAEFDWTELINPAISLGSNALAAKVGAGASKADSVESGRQFDIRTKRQDEIRRMMLPGLQTNLGMRPTAYNPGTPAATPNPTVQSGGGLGNKILGLGAGAAMGGAIPGVGMGTVLAGLNAIPVAGQIAAGVGGLGLLASKAFGRGRRQADKLTGEGGLATNFDAALAEAHRAPLNEQQRAEAIRYLYNKLQQDSAAFAGQGSQQAKVVQQMLDGYRTNPATLGALR